MQWFRPVALHLRPRCATAVLSPPAFPLHVLVSLPSSAFEHVLDRALHSTESVLDEEVEGVSIASIGELGVLIGTFLQALGRHCGEVAREGRVFRQDGAFARHQGVDEASSVRGIRHGSFQTRRK